MRIAVQGCCHGELDAIYEEIARQDEQDGKKTELLIICGDFEAIRNRGDLEAMAVPDKYKHMQTFWKYYCGERVAPVLTIFIGGNHEASNYLWELYHGGWAAPNIFYLGHAGCVRVNGLRIAGASGIFKGYNFRTGHHEHPPYDSNTMRSCYHIREFNTRRLSLLSSPEIFLSHDWPQGIEQYGDVDRLLRKKPFWKEEVRNGTLGSPPLTSLLHTLTPGYWFAAHMHAAFRATVHHGPAPTPAPEELKNPDEITIDDDEFDDPAPAPEPTAAPAPTSSSEAAASAPAPAHPETRFLALDKCLPKRKFLEILDISAPEESIPDQQPSFTFDAEWLAITRAFAPYFSTAKHQRAFPLEAPIREVIAREMEWVKTNLGTATSAEPSTQLDSTASSSNSPEYVKLKPISSILQFAVTAPVHVPGEEKGPKPPQPGLFPNPQTRAFCAMLQIQDRINPS
ncbi:hypothetical protein CYLTODRAFT_459026 [Cylindrobasidium torrendii FP15055 ss-10]|uniref:Lariat debranching enzyme C-terminal domain-containing protein n=1 Tax=Cylindrobasidium torrendii FP15055 ss-10 TaxID=1314674 RepID=A0A0D7AX05_9AGAR|nr:hypothetical protein CYLTODRAFT_459026 [Cylindrobasidium torrendii FP15055 ss-10]